MKISTILLLVVAMFGGGSGTQPATASAESGGDQARQWKVVRPERRASKKPAEAGPIKVVPNSPKANAAIEAEIRKAAGKPVGELTKADLEKVTKFELGDKQITDLTPLAGLTELEYLYLDNNQITDLAPLVGLTKLKSLLLRKNQITDLTPLAGLTMLERLWINNNKISKLTPLAGLKNLKVLRLDEGYNHYGYVTEAEVFKLQHALPRCRINPSRRHFGQYRNRHYRN